MQTSKLKIEPILKDTYLQMIKNSIGSKSFRNAYAMVNDKKTDITKNGDSSCALFVSSILVIFKLIKEIHVTVNGTLKDMKKNGWQEIKEPREGCILIWKEKETGEKHKHIGFYIGNDKAVSNNAQKRYPTKHKWDIYNGRKLEAIFWNPKIK